MPHALTMHANVSLGRNGTWDTTCTAAGVEALSRIYERLLDRYFDA